MLAACCSLLITVTRHRVCCRIPAWTAYVGQRWDTFDVAPYNLFNVWWRLGQWVSKQVAVAEMARREQ
jgi:hypothetical protein